MKTTLNFLYCNIQFLFKFVLLSISEARNQYKLVVAIRVKKSIGKNS